MRFNELKLADFAKWLRERPADQRYLDGPPSWTCPVAKFSGLRSAAHMPGMPEWASYFISRFDAEDKGSQAMALKILAQTEARFADAAETSQS